MVNGEANTGNPVGVKISNNPPCKNAQTKAANNGTPILRGRAA